MKSRTIYACETCGLESTVEAEIARCEAAPIRRHPAKVGDLVTGGHAYGWWFFDRPEFMEWWHPEPGDPDHRSHHVRGRKGWPLYVVVDIIPAKEVSRQTGPYAHREVAVLFSPHHANRGSQGGIALVWADDRIVKRGEVTPERLEELRSLIPADATPVLI
jgi:hypothetical protein